MHLRNERNVFYITFPIYTFSLKKLHKDLSAYKRRSQVLIRNFKSLNTFKNEVFPPWKNKKKRSLGSALEAYKKKKNPEKQKQNKEHQTDAITYFAAS